MDPLTMLQLGGGLIGGIANMMGGNERKRIEEEYNRKAYQGLLGTQDRLNSMNPQATLRAQQQQIGGIQGAAIAGALNSATGAAANAGMSGDVGATNINAVRGSVAAQQAAAPMAQMQSQALSEAQQAEAQRTGMLQQNAGQIASLSNNVAYDTQQKKNPLMDLLQGATGGINTGGNIYDLFNRGGGSTTALAPGRV